MLDVLSKRILEESLKEIIENKLPEFAKSVHDKKTEFIFFHQDSFAADYQPNEYLLLGMAIKYAGLFGKRVRIAGVNRETVGRESDTIPF